MTTTNKPATSSTNKPSPPSSALTLPQIVKLCYYVTLSIPTFIVNLIPQGKQTSALTSALAATLRKLMPYISRDPALKVKLFGKPMEQTFDSLKSFKSTRHYSKRFAEATNSTSLWVYEKEGRTRADPVMVFIHGGAFELKVHKSQIEHVHTICKQTGISAMMVEYGTIPTYKFPTQLDECLDTYKALNQSCDRIIIAGDSAGGNLATAVALKLKELNLPLWGYYTVAPWVQLYPRNTGSWVANAELDWITGPRLEKAAQLYTEHGKYDHNKIAQPYLATAEEWKGAMPKNSVVVYGKCELFADQCAELIKTAQVSDSFAQEGAVHDHSLVFDKSGPANEFVFAVIKRWLE